MEYEPVSDTAQFIIYKSLAYCTHAFIYIPSSTLQILGADLFSCIIEDLFFRCTSSFLYPWPLSFKTLEGLYSKTLYTHVAAQSSKSL